MNKEKAPNAQKTPRKFVERRQKKDWVTRMVPFFSAVGWIAAFITILFLDRAKPQQANLFTRIFNTPINNAWNASLLRIVLITLIAVFVVCVTGLLFNMSRHRRKGDRYNRSVLVLGILSLCGILMFLWRFGVLLFPQ